MRLFAFTPPIFGIKIYFLTLCPTLKVWFFCGELRKICALEYNGETYLSLNDVLNEYSKNEKTAHIVGPTIMALSISVGALLFVVNYKKNRGK